MNQDEAIFEAPASHEGYGPSGFANQETFETPGFEWEMHEASHYGQPETSFEDETYESSYEALGENEWNESSYYSQPEASYEDESDPFIGNILGTIGSAIGLESEDELEQESVFEADPFFGKAFRAIKSVAKKVAPIAKALAPKVVGSLVSMIPGVGAVAGPLAGKLTSALVREGEHEAASVEAQLFSNQEGQFEIGSTEAGQEAALTELLAHEAVMAESESEAEAVLSAALPITITIMGGRRALRPVMPTLAQANGRLIRSLRQQGPAGQQLLRTVPAIQRRAVGTLRAAARQGKPTTSPLAVRAMAAATRSVLSNPQQVKRTIERNGLVRTRVAPPNVRRAAVFAPNRGTPSHPRRNGAYTQRRSY